MKNIFEEKVISIYWHSTHKEYTGKTEYMSHYPTLDSVLREFKSRNADVTEVTLKEYGLWQSMLERCFTVLHISRQF